MTWTWRQPICATLFPRNSLRDDPHHPRYCPGPRAAAPLLGAVFVLVVFCVRAAGIPADTVSFLAVLLSFAIARLAGALPITPGGLGSVDAAFTGMLIAFGATASSALAADLVWRATTYFPPIFIGIVTYVAWKRGLAQGTYTKDPDVRPAAVPG